jgi:hypothetical protein
MWAQRCICAAARAAGDASDENSSKMGRVCYGAGKRDCKTCGGTGTTIGCPNFRSHRLWPWHVKVRSPSPA